MRQSHSQEEGERGWYVSVCVCVYVRAYVINKYITVYVVTLHDIFCVYAMSVDNSICCYIIVQTDDVGLHSKRHPMEFDAGTRPFALFDATSS